MNGRGLRRLLGALLVTGLLAAAALMARGAFAGRDDDTTPPAPVTPEVLERGRQLALVGNCAGCHTARGGVPLAGGRVLATPFGQIVTGNLTPDDDTGLGRWTVVDFRRALHQGRSRDGRLLLPAFPYTETTRAKREDIDAIFAWLQRQPPVRGTAASQALRFPYNTPLALALWRGLYFTPGRHADDPGHDALWNRGAYLAQGLGHCASCHAPRNALGATVDAAALAGGPVGAEAWWAPALGGLAVDETVALLRDGVSTHRAAAGPMAEVVARSTQHWAADDLRAVATYLASLPAPPRPAPAAPAPTEQRTLGRLLYVDHCADCHGADGAGSPRAVPALAGNRRVLDDAPTHAILMVLRGGFAPSTAGNPRPHGMPPLALGDDEIAAVLTDVRQRWGAPGSAVTAREVQRLR